MFLALSAITFSVLCLPAQAKEPQKSKDAAAAQTMEYDVYAGGFHVVSSDLDIDTGRKGRYRLRLAAYTHGMLAKLAPWKGIFQTDGWYDPAGRAPHPEKHFSDTTWRDERELTEFLYNKDGSFKEYRITNEKEKGPKETDPALSAKTTDVLTATLKVMNGIARDGTCAGRDEVFDGDRRYALVYTHGRAVTLASSDLNVYAGPATECTVEVKPIAGKWHSKPRGWMSIQEQGRERGTMPTVWFAKMADGAPAIPVKIRVKTEYGTLFMHLTGYKGAGKTLTLKR